MTTQLGLYNQALVTHLGERKLTALDSPATEKSQIVLDTIWDAGAVDTLLEMGYWNFAMRTVAINYNASLTSAFGFRYIFDKPTDHIATAAVSLDPYFASSLIRYTDETAYLYADYDPIYVKYVSNDSQYGADMSLWPQSFEKAFACYLAKETCMSIKQDRQRWTDLEVQFDRLLSYAKAKDALAQPVKPGPRSSWARSRGSRTDNEI